MPKGDIGCFSALLGKKQESDADFPTQFSEAKPSSSVIQPKEVPKTSLKNIESIPVSYGGPCAYCGAGWSEMEQTSSRSVVLDSQEKLPPYASVPELDHISDDVAKTVEGKIDEANKDLRELSLALWEHPEVAYQERYAHDKLTEFMGSHGFTVTKHYLGLETAWRAEFVHGKGGRTIGLQSEMDALPDIGHACGHNLIAIIGVAIALALKTTMEKHDISGKLVLLGTPAEEHDGGKIALLKKGAYDDMDVCVMAHPGPAIFNGTSLQPWLALQPIEVEFIGHSAHAAYAPWEAKNALDAAFLAYSGVSVLRQQIKPDQRVHGIIVGHDWEPNVIPDYAKMRWIVRASTWAELDTLRERVSACFKAAALAAGCKINLELGVAYKDVRQNIALGDEYIRVASSRYGLNARRVDAVNQASSDFGDVSYALPSIQPAYSLSIATDGSNHTPQFADAARTPKAHEESLVIAKALALTALRVLNDEAFFDEVKASFVQTGVL